MQKGTITLAALFSLSAAVFPFLSLPKNHSSPFSETDQKTNVFLVNAVADGSPVFFFNRISEYRSHNAGKNKRIVNGRWRRKKAAAIKADIRDPKGQKIKISFTGDGGVQFSSNAAAEFKALALGMTKTAIGLEILQRMYSSPTRILIEINKVDTPLTVEGHYIMGQTTPVISIKVDGRGRQIGRPYISSARIVLFEACIKHMVAENNGKVLMNGVTIDLRPFSIPDIVASVAVHEATHVLY
ncbi:MAG: hypothetical protein ICV84_17675, partial [Flavisolibacter sp.]|nr:hypothetical protein [Flavisolibacter sp.]